MSDRLGVADVAELLRRFGAASNDIVLIGGQAVNFWAERYLARGEHTLLAHAPYTSKDVDLCGTVRAGRKCAAAIGARLLVPDPDDATPQACAIKYRDAANRERSIDVLKTPFGLKRSEVVALALPFAVEASEGRLWVMHPVHCLESRVCNVAGLPGYSGAHALGQLRAAITCARAFLRELIDADPRNVRAVLTLNERIFRFSLRGRHARAVYASHGIDPFHAVLVDPRLPVRFCDRRYPQMLAALAVRPARW